MQKEKVRIYALARELNVDTKDLLDLCKQQGMDVKNQLSSLDPEQRDQIVQLLKKSGTPAAAPQRPASAPLPTPVATIRTLPASRPPVLAPKPAAKKEPTVPAAAPTPTAPAAVAAPPVPESTTTPVPAIDAPPAPKPTAEPPVTVPPVETAPAVHSPQPPPPEQPSEPTAPAAATPPVRPAASIPPPIPPMNPPRVRDLSGRPRPGTTPPPGGSAGTAGGDRTTRRPMIRHTGREARPVPPAPLKQPQGKPPEPKPADRTGGARRIAAIPQNLLNQPGNRRPEDIIRDIVNNKKPATTGEVGPELPDEPDGDKARRPGEVAGRDARHKERSERQKLRKEKEAASKSTRVGLLDEDDRYRGSRKLKKRIKGTVERKAGSKIPIDMPITVRSLSEAIGMKSVELCFKLMGMGVANPTINSLVEPDTAQLIALEKGVELDIKKRADAEQDMLEGLKKPDNPEDLLPRAPVVTIMGHVDHGKTSLLDKIRRSNVVDTEAGGITQVIRAWRVEHKGHPITFLDTPGHEAFTKMRARGANVTDIAVIVVAADDGVMPQTEEAINHAKAAGVSIVVAINKTDLPNANLRKTEQQLYGMGLIPDTMGGEVPFVQTSAATGKGIDELLEQISTVAELMELKANPNKAAGGTCLEANVDEGKGVLATVLVREGTLRLGDVMLCGATYGRVRAMYDDLGRPIEEAGPSVPVRITGLDEVPNADDPFQVVPELSVASDIAEKRKARLREASVSARAPMTLESLSATKVTELKVILKADFRGSVEAIRKELEKLYHEEVRVRVLHAAIGGITESDVQLALTSPDDTIIVGFNAVPDDRALSLADERGVQIREYDIIYKLTDDIRSALEGKLKPREEVIHLGRALVRETFKISRVGTIAGCYVTQGTIERSAKVRVIRGGVVVYPPADRTVGLESLKRFKEDTREVREGFECGIKIAGYDDIKKDDVIECYRVEQVQRTLS